MSFIPNRSKFRKHQKGRAFNRINKKIDFDQLKFGSIGLKSLDFGRLNSKQIESVRQAVNKVIKKSGRTIIHAFPDSPVSKKPAEVRMGKGKGAVSHWVFKIRPGFLLCEVESSSSVLAIKALENAQTRLPMKTKIIFN
jgi:large subunit ribosomal protein L16